jgi:hypothetical protein
VPNPNITIRNFFIAVRGGGARAQDGVRVRPVYKTPWQEPLEEMSARRLELRTRRKALETRDDAPPAQLELVQVRPSQG